MITAVTGVSFSAQAASKNVSIAYSVEENYDYAAKVAQLVNQNRAKKGAKKLKMNKQLTEYAMQRAAELALLYSHTRPNGESCTKPKIADSENIAYGYGNPSEVMYGWLHSPPHKKNLLKKTHKAIGVGCALVNGTYYWVQIFADKNMAASTSKGIVQNTRSVSVTRKKLYTFVLAKDFRDIDNQSASFIEEGETSLAHEDYPQGVQICLSAVHKDNDSSAFGSPILLPSTVSYSSSNASAMTVNSNGIASIVGNGSTKVTAKLKGTSFKGSQTFTTSKNIDVSISENTFVYNGSVQTPTVKVYNRYGNDITNTLSISMTKGSEVGKYYISIEDNAVETEDGIEINEDFRYDELYATYSIIPQGTSINKVKKGKSSFTVTWKKQAVQTSGYEIQYATNKGFTKNTGTVQVGKNSTLKTTIKGLKAKTKYFVRIRTFGKEGGINIYSKWSAAKTVKTK